MRHPRVGEYDLSAKAVAAPDSVYGEVVAVFIQMTAGETASDDAMLEMFKGKVASSKIPRYVRFVDSWPMSGTKIMKRRLREMISEELVCKRTPEEANRGEGPSVE